MEPAFNRRPSRAHPDSVLACLSEPPIRDASLSSSAVAGKYGAASRCAVFVVALVD
jgi:hypothetical protein